MRADRSMALLSSWICYFPSLQTYGAHACSRLTFASFQLQRSRLDEKLSESKWLITAETCIVVPNCVRNLIKCILDPCEEVMPSQRIMAVHLPTGPYVYLSRLWSNNSSMKRCAGPCCSWPSRLRRFSTFWGSQGMSMNVDDTIPTIKRYIKLFESQVSLLPRCMQVSLFHNCHGTFSYSTTKSYPGRSRLYASVRTWGISFIWYPDRYSSSLEVLTEISLWFWSVTSRYPHQMLRMSLRRCCSRELPL